MANNKVYSITINGIQESVKAVDSLNDALSFLEQKINKLQSANINVSSSSSSSGSSSRSSNLKEEDALLKQIQKTEQEIANAQREEYQNLLANKELLKQAREEAQQRAAQERLAADSYANSMEGLKQKLADIKKVMQTTDLGSDEFKNLTTEANNLNAKLLEIEKSYGQFGRNVGNYKTAVDGFKGIVIEVGGVTREFDNARQASRELGNELKTMAINGQQGTKEFKDLQKAVAELDSNIKDATVSSKAMDKMLDTLQSFAAIGSITEGFSALFGFDNDEIERSIQKLVALQNVMKGIEELKQQMNSGEGLGGWIAKGNDAIDSFVEKITSAKDAQEAATDATKAAKKAQETLNTTTTAGKTASEALATAQTAQATATKGATLATKGLSLALKALGIGLVISLIATLITYWEDIYKWMTDTVPVLKNVSTWFDKLRAVAVGVGTALINYIIQPFATIGKTIKAIMEGNFKEIPKIISDGLKKQFDVIGNFQKGYHKETERQQEVHNEKMREQQRKANEEAEKDAEAKYGKDYARTKAYLKKQLALTKEGSEEYKKIQRQLWETERREREEKNKKNLSDTKKSAKEEAEAEAELAKLRIENMKEGLRKTISQLEEERKARLLKLNTNLRNYKELEAQINALYDKKIEDAEKKHGEELIKIQSDVYRKLLDARLKMNQQGLSLIQMQWDNVIEDLSKPTKNNLFNQGISSYGIQGKNQYSPSTRQSLGIISEDNSEIIKDYKKLIDLKRDYQIASNVETMVVTKNMAELEKLQKHSNSIVIGIMKKRYEEEEAIVKTNTEKIKAIYESFNSELEEKYKAEEAHVVMQKLLEENYTSDLNKMFVQRLTAVDTFWNARLEAERSKAIEAYQQQEKIENDSFKKQKDDENKFFSDQLQQQSEYIAKKKDGIEAQAKTEKWTQEELNIELENTDKEYNKVATEAFETHKKNLETIEASHTAKITQLENDRNNKLKKSNGEYYNEMLQEFRDFHTALNNLERKQPVMNVWGIVNLKKTNENNKQLLSSYEQLASEIAQKRKKLNDDFKNGIIDENVYKSSLRELDSFADGLGEKMDAVKHELSTFGKIEALSAGINQWVQAVGGAVNDILSSLSEIQSNEYDRMIEQQEKYIQEYEELLQKQEDVTREHSDNVNSIEDELRTARGDRRDYLIDQLNAEMAAQRASLAQEKKIEREKEKEEEKKKKLEHDQAVAKKKMQLAQAYINMAMAISMAAVNSWPIPAIPMMALAAATGAAQIAAIQSQNIPSYGDGGIIQGKSHKEGGVKANVGSQPIELEGNEFIIRKKTATKNIDLLDFVNRSEKKLSLDDMIDFYSNGKSIKKSISTPRTKFANGGMIPKFRSDITINDRLLTAFEDYSNRPTVVSVVDIIDRTNAVNEVRAIAGIE